MKFLILATALLAATSASPISSHTLEVGNNGVVGSSVLSPLVSLVININKAIENLVSVEGLPATAPEQPSESQPEPVLVVDHPEAVGLPEIVVVPETPSGPNVVDQVVEQPTVVVQPETPSGPTVVDQVVEQPSVVLTPETPSGPNVVDQVVEQPTVVVQPETPSGPTVVDQVVEQPSVVLTPETPSGPNVVDQVVEQPTVVVQPESPSGPVVVVDQPELIANPEPIMVIEQPEASPIAVVSPESPASGVTNNYFLNFFLNFISGADDTSSVSSSNLPSFMQQLLRNAPSA